MRLHIENFAKIANADIEINGITVIAGENNTGKSTVGKVLYSLFDSFYNITSRVDNQRKMSVRGIIDDLGYYDPEKDDYEFFINTQLTDFDDMYEELLHDIKQTHDKKLLASSVQKILQVYSHANFNVRKDEFIDCVNKIIDVFSIADDQIRKNLVLRTFNTEFNNDFYTKLNNNADSSIYLNIKSQSIELNFKQTSNGAIVEQINRFLPLNSQIVYLDNPGVIDQLDNQFRFRFSRNRNHEDNLIRKLQIENHQNIVEETLMQYHITDIKDKITDIIHGSFVVDDKKLKFKEEGFASAHTIGNLSTGVKSFAILLRLLDNGYINKNSCIILDEPEVHLHPKWQLKYAELLVMLQKQLDLHVLINSHSPYFISAIEEYSKEYNIQDKCNYYLADLKSNVACFKNVNKSTGEIYDKLAEPFDELDRLMSKHNKLNGEIF